MNTVSYPSKPDVEREWRGGRDSFTKTIVDVAAELGVEPRRESTRLQDVTDIDALFALVGTSERPNRHVVVSFSIWGIRYVVTPETVAATKEV